MAFSSVQFLFVFLPLSLAVYWLCPKWLRNAVLAAFSLLFFAWAGLKGAAILVLLAGINWLGGLSLGRLAHKRPLLILLILLDLAVLGGFKYAGFAAETVNALVPGLLPVLSPALPLGLSFYVFTAIGYCADVAAGKVESEKNPIRFAVFLAFFGHGPSGPIVRCRKILSIRILPAPSANTGGAGISRCRAGSATTSTFRWAAAAAACAAPA